MPEVTAVLDTLTTAVAALGNKGEQREGQRQMCAAVAQAMTSKKTPRSGSGHRHR